MPTKWGMLILPFERDVFNGTRRVETALAIVTAIWPREFVAADPLQCLPANARVTELRLSRPVGNGDAGHRRRKVVGSRSTVEYQEGRGIGLMAKLEAYQSWLRRP